ncbi:hypothetical protein [Rugosimonospora africana]|nr:hypothetical protein [Rugosimonospora africana]
MILIGSIFGHHAIGDPISTVILGLLLGIFVFAASSYGFTIVRSMYLSDGLLTPADRRGSNAGPPPHPSPSFAIQ